jgi:lysyl-tRNA synthetase, class II
MSEAAPPYRFPGTTPIADVVATFRTLEAGESTPTTVTVAGRVLLSRPQGRVAFAQCRDWTGTIQLFALEVSTEDFEAFTKITLGDWVGATGEVIRTRRGELSVQVRSWTVLAHAREGFGDKWHGVADPDLRYRQREVDLWANEGVREVFLARSRAVRAIRDHLDNAGYVEVETPVLQPLAGGALARPFVTHYNALHAPFFLRIATELYLKRLVVGGFEKVYEIGKDFRNEGLSPRHNPEFTMLEAYAAYDDYIDMAGLIEQLVAAASRAVSGTEVLSFGGRPLDLTPPWRRLTLEEAVTEVTGVEVSLAMGATELTRRANDLGVEVPDGAGPGKVLGEIYEKTTEHELWEPVHVMDYPAEISPLTRAHRSRPGYAERLTPIVAGREIGEAYSELVDPDDQRQRLEAQAALRAAGDEEAMAIDEEFLSALEHGMPPTGGIGIGIDRLCMILCDQPNIKEVLLFPALRPRDRADRSDAEDEKTS